MNPNINIVFWNEYGNISFSDYSVNHRFRQQGEGCDILGILFLADTSFGLVE